ncbi:hypothetical protein BC827DRAFT_260609 [Russula dissimulans]|nr:hypothetical protein BC827DRAFT_260609 [Russula dissimulans]
MSSHQATSSSTPPQESTSTPPATYSVSTPIGAAQTMLSFLGQAATARENPNTNTTTAVLGAADTVLSRLVVPSRSSGSAPHRDSAPHREAPTVSYAPPPAIRHVPEVVPREQSPDSHQAAPASPLAEVPRRVSDPSTMAMAAQAVPGPTSISSHGGGGGRALTPPRATAARVTHSSYPALPETIPPPRPVHVSHGGGAYRRRSTGPYPDSETAWNEQDDEDIVRPR